MGSPIIRTPIKLETGKAIKNFVLGGNAFFMVVSNKTNYTINFYVQKSSSSPGWYVIKSRWGKMYDFKVVGYINPKMEFVIPPKSCFTRGSKVVMGFN